VEEYWPWVGGICKCLGANARGFPGVNPPGWPLISALTAFDVDKKLRETTKRITWKTSAARDQFLANTVK